MFVGGGKYKTLRGLNSKRLIFARMTAKNFVTRMYICKNVLYIGDTLSLEWLLTVPAVDS